MSMKKETLYQKIAATMARQIKTGIWKMGEKLPSLRTISNEYGVSLNTAIQAYYELEKDGFIISLPKSVILSITSRCVCRHRQRHSLQLSLREKGMKI